MKYENSCSLTCLSSISANIVFVDTWNKSSQTKIFIQSIKSTEGKEGRDFYANVMRRNQASIGSLIYLTNGDKLFLMYRTNIFVVW